METALKFVRGRVEALGEPVRAFLSSVDRILATVLGVSFTAMMLGHWGQGVMQDLLGDGVSRTELGGGLKDALVLGAVGLSIWGFSFIRERLSATMGFLPWSAEPNILRLYGLLEGGLCMVGVGVAMVWPTAGAVLFAVFATSSVAALAVLRGFEERQRTLCDTCGAKVHRCALYCPSCSGARVASRLGLFGRARERKVQDAGAHRLRLLGARRCHRCAEPLEVDGPSSRCRRCDTAAFPDTEALKQFLSYADKRWLALVPVLALLGLVPLLGAILGLWLFRVSPAGALGAYARSRDQVSSGLLRQLGLLGIAVLQPLPLVGAAVVPALVGVLYAQSRLALSAGASTLGARQEGNAGHTAHADAGAGEPSLEPGAVTTGPQPAVGVLSGNR